MKGGISSGEAITRLTALWAFTEAGLGGILHLIKTPFSGLILCGLAIVYLFLIARLSNYNPKIILRSLLLVLLIKMMVSPHSGITAYFAVGFQGIMAALIFGIFKRSTLALFLFAIIAMLESAAQRLIVLTLLFGMDFWSALDEFGHRVYNVFFTGGEEVGFSWIMIGTYLGIYALGGTVAAVLCLRISSRLEGIRTGTLPQPEKWWEAGIQRLPSRSSSPFRKIINWVILAGLMVFTILFSSSLSGFSGALYIFTRTVLVILVWVFIVSPLAFLLLRKFLKKRLEESRRTVADLRSLFPWIKSIVYYSWNQTSGKRGVFKLETFLVLTLYYLLNSKG